MSLWPCTVIPSYLDVGRNFQVKVQNHRGPVEGLSIKISSGRGEYHAATDKRGVAIFHDIPSGDWYVSTSLNDGISGAPVLKINARKRSSITVPLTWPGIDPIPVRSLKGNLILDNFIGGVDSQPKMTIALVEGISGRPLQSVEAGSDGAFDLDSPSAGLYFLRIGTTVGREAVDGFVAVEVDPRAAAESLNLDLTWSSCGLAYTDQSTCPKSSFRFSQARGRVVDPTGAPLSKTQVYLSNSTSVVVEQQSNAAGEFSIAAPSAGEYQFGVRRLGFTDFRARLTSTPGMQSETGLVVQLGVAGSCSQARLH